MTYKKKRGKQKCYVSTRQNVEAEFHSTCLLVVWMGGGGGGVGLVTHLGCNYGNDKECQKQKRDKLCHWGD